MKSACIIGAGKQGRGILAYLCYLNDIQVCFIDQDKRMIEQMRKQRFYHIHFLQKTKASLPLPCADALHLQEEEQVAKRIAQADLLFTSVPSKEIYALGQVLGKFLSAQTTQGGKAKNIILCENALDKLEQFRKGIEEYGGPEIYERYGICEALSMSMAIQTNKERDSLDSSIQDDMCLFINKNQVKGDLWKLKAVRYVDNFESLRKQALYTNNTSSALVSYLGHLLGYTTLQEAIQDERIHSLLEACYEEINQTLIRDLGVLPADQKRFAEFAKQKYTHSEDRIDRHAKEVLRKLGREERLTGICKRAMANDITPNVISLGLAAALFYHKEGDRDAMELETLWKQTSLNDILWQVCGLSPSDPLTTLIKERIHWLIEHHYLCQDEIMTKLSKC